jgi:hypothetical protein
VCLPLGLLDSPPHQEEASDGDASAAGINAMCAAILTVPTVAVLPTPFQGATAGPDAVPESEGPEVESTMRRSKRLAARPASSQKPAERARDTKLKKLGLTEQLEDPKLLKKQHLLLAYKGGNQELAEEAISDLLGRQAQVV